MKNLRQVHLSDDEKAGKSFRVWSIIFQLRIYAGFIMSIFSELRNPNPQINIGLVLFELVIFSPLIVCLILFYKRRKSFRVWYIVGVALIAIITLLSGTIPLLSSVVEVFVIIALFHWKYVNKNFASNHSKNESLVAAPIKEMGNKEK